MTKFKKIRVRRKGKEFVQNNIEPLFFNISDVLRKLSKAELKKNYTVTQLKTYCKELELTNYSKLKEDELVDLIFNSLNGK